MSRDRPTVFSRKGSPYWYVNLSTPRGRRRTTTKYKISEHSKDEVRQIFCAKILIDPELFKKRTYTLLWLRDTLIDSLEDEGLRDQTILSYRAAVGHLIALYGKDCPIAEIQRRPHVQQIREHLFERGLKPPTINKTLRGCRALWERLVDRDITTENPFRRFKPMRMRLTTPQHFTIEQLITLFNALSESGKKDYVRIVRILLYTGRRITEILDLERNDIDPLGLRFRPMNVKHRDKRKRWIAIPSTVKDDFDYFVNSGREYPCRVGTRYALSEWFREWRRKAGLPEGLRLHSLRHTFVTLGLESGESAWKIKEYLDHSSITVTEGYAHTESVGTVDIGFNVP